MHQPTAATLSSTTIMFRKPFAHYNSGDLVPLRMFDQRRFRNIVMDDFSVTPEAAELLLPEGLYCVRFKTKERVAGVAYVTLEGVPLWFTLGKNMDNLVPTVYTLWKHHNLLPILSIPGNAVPAMLHAPFWLGSNCNISFEPSASIAIGKLVCIAQEYEPMSSGTPRIGSALAVARMVLPSQLIEKGAKGKALTLLHAWKDHLWVMGGEERPPRSRLLEASLDEEDDVDKEWASEDIEAVAEEIQSDGSSDGDMPEGLSPEVVSDALRSALLESIFVTLSKLPPGSFPITPSIFYETYILPYRSFQLTENTKTPVDIKHSSFKSLTVFLKARAKEGLIKIKENKGGMVVTGIDEIHPSVRAHVRHVTLKDVEAHQGKQEEAQAQKIEKVEMKQREREVTCLRKPGPASAALFQHIGEDPDDLFTEDDIKTITTQYLASKHLLKPRDQDSVNVTKDKLLLDILSNGKKADRIKLLEKRFMDINDVVQQVFRSTKPWYEISTGGGQPIVREGKPHPVVIKIVWRQDYTFIYHTVTYISGFEIFHLDADSLAEELKTACASATAVQPNFHDSNLKQIMVQGEQVEAVTECLIARGMQRQWIRVINHTGVKLKKRDKETHAGVDV